MKTDDPRRLWPPELIELSIMTEIHRLAFIFKYIVSERPSGGQGYREDDVGMAARTIGSFEAVLEDARLPPEMDECLRTVILAFRARPGPLPPELADGFHDRVVDCLLRDLPAVPSDVKDYQQRIAQLMARHWIGDVARVIPQGWLPIVERAVRVGEASIEAAAFAGVSAVFMGEEFGRLQWAFNGHRERFAAILSYVGTATSVACMGCACPGVGDQGPSEGRILTLCNRHRELRRQDERAFLEALYPGGPPDHPDVKLY